MTLWRRRPSGPQNAVRGVRHDPDVSGGAYIVDSVEHSDPLQIDLAQYEPEVFRAAIWVAIAEQAVTDDWTPADHESLRTAREALDKSAPDDEPSSDRRSPVPASVDVTTSDPLPAGRGKGPGRESSVPRGRAGSSGTA
jgi:hypothetical protein